MVSETSLNDLKIKVNNRQILSMALPIALAILVPQLNMLTNSIFLGNLSEQALGNAGITGIIYLIFAVVGHGLNNAIQSIFSKYAGGDQTNLFHTIFSQGIRISLIFAIAGILITWFLLPTILSHVADPKDFPQEMTFLRIRIFGLPFLYLFLLGNAFLVSTLNSKLLIVGFVCETVVNILLDYFLIFGKAAFPKMGFNGAAVASVIAESFGVLAVYTVIYKKGLQKRFKLFQNFLYNKKLSREILYIATPLILQFVISISTWFVFFLLIEEKGSTAKAISNTVRNVFGLCGVFVWAFAGTCNAMVSNLIGQRKEDKVIEAIKKIMLWSFSCCAFMCLIFNIFPDKFFMLFGQGQIFVNEAIPVIRTVSIGLLIMSTANIWLNAVTGTGKTTYNLMIEILAITSYLIYTWIFMKLHYISLAMAWTNEIVYWSVILTCSLLFFKSGKWRVDRKTDDTD